MTKEMQIQQQKVDSVTLVPLQVGLSNGAVMQTKQSRCLQLLLTGTAESRTEIAKLEAGLKPSAAMEAGQQLSVYQKYNFPIVIAGIGGLLQRLFRFMGATSNVHDEDIIELSEAILCTYYYMKFEELLYVFNRGKLGKYGTTYGKPTMATVMQWLEAYDTGERMQVIEDRRVQKKANAESLMLSPELTQEQVNASYLLKHSNDVAFWKEWVNLNQNHTLMKDVEYLITNFDALTRPFDEPKKADEFSTIFAKYVSQRLDSVKAQWELCNGKTLDELRLMWHNSKDLNERAIIQEYGEKLKKEQQA
jgi:hypothetical protein